MTFVESMNRLLRMKAEATGEIHTPITEGDVRPAEVKIHETSEGTIAQFNMEGDQ